MMNRIWAILGAFVAILATALITYYVNRSAPDVRYTLSEKIPLTFGTPGNNNIETVQQLEVKNIGNAKANKVVVKINSELANYSIEKYAASDDVQVFNKQPQFEIVYAELPPQAGFTLVFESSGNGIEYSDLEISDDTGAAHEALSNSGSDVSNILETLLIPLVILYGILNAWQIRHGLVDLWKINLDVDNIQVTLNSKKPWYVLTKEWPILRNDVIVDKITKEYVGLSNLEKSIAYKLLKVDVSETQKMAGYDELKEVATNRVQTVFTSAINSAAATSMLVDLLRVTEPPQIPAAKWNDLKQLANQQFVALMKRRIYGIDSVYNLLKEGKPIEITHLSWAMILEYCISIPQHVAVDKIVAYKILELDMPEITTKPEYNQIIDLAVEQLRQSYQYAVNSAYRSESLLDLIRIKKPAQFPNSIWIALQKSANQEYIILIKTELIRPQEALDKLKRPKPDEITDATWEEVVNFYLNQYYESLLTGLRASRVPLEFARKSDVSVLDDSSKSTWQDIISVLENTDKQAK